MSAGHRPDRDQRNGSAEECRGDAQLHTGRGTTLGNGNFDLYLYLPSHLGSPKG